MMKIIKFRINGINSLLIYIFKKIYDMNGLNFILKNIIYYI
jgi:hypothetical protein